jgi:chromosome transmission fidelity protein 8
MPLPEDVEISGDDISVTEDSQQTPIGRLVFPKYSADAPAEDTSWMKRVHLYVGQHQRLTGEVKKLPKPMAVIRKTPSTADEMEGIEGIGDQNQVEQLEIVEVIKYKILFSQRPEPVGGS